ncbi:hypothetical protein NB550_11010 [Vibrio parahaemolyticus]|uniref:hypothetical protein n=1 Tax=Vibrio parahaemolyticus TaxID=670 RepID=UPI00215CB5B0|nr:hypothetical protein [Vibrio parahaemolyticus]MCR9888088.1 hypothetical protein [Vibrio parahaemolyticus]MCR9918018.1 hypothetical protein [Vibrio parahaemolyticus]
MSNTRNKLDDESVLNNSDFTISNNNSIRILVNDKSIGLATTTYSYSLTPELKSHAAERIFLSLQLAKGLSNEHLLLRIQNKLAEIEVGKLAHFRFNDQVPYELYFNLNAITRRIDDFKSEMLNVTPDEEQLKSRLIEMRELIDEMLGKEA